MGGRAQAGLTKVIHILADFLLLAEICDGFACIYGYVYTVSMEACLPDDKLEKGRLLIRSFLGRHKITLGVTKHNHHIRLTSQVTLHLLVWHDFLERFNGKSFFVDDICDYGYTPAYNIVSHLLLISQ